MCVSNNRAVGYSCFRFQCHSKSTSQPVYSTHSSTCAIPLLCSHSNKILGRLPILLKTRANSSNSHQRLNELCVLVSLAHRRFKIETLTIESGGWPQAAQRHRKEPFQIRFGVSALSISLWISCGWIFISNQSVCVSERVACVAAGAARTRQQERKWAFQFVRRAHPCGLLISFIDCAMPAFIQAIRGGSEWCIDCGLRLYR